MRWHTIAGARPGSVEVKTRDGRKLEACVAAANGNPQNTLTRDELAAKAQQLAAYSGGAGLKEVCRIVSKAWTLRDAPDVS